MLVQLAPEDGASYKENQNRGAEGLTARLSTRWLTSLSCVWMLLKGWKGSDTGLQVLPSKDSS